MPNPISDIVSSYSDPVIRAYSRVRFTILRQPFLEEIDQWLPTEGRVLDIGAGFGLFSLYFATIQPKRELVGVDLDARRIELARKSAEHLGLRNVSYHVGNVLEWDAAGEFDAIYMLDVIHHLPHEMVPDFLEKLTRRLKPNGTLLVKEVANRPHFKMLFTLALDRLMVGMEPIRYWAPAALTQVIKNLGFEVKRHVMNDVLPYPHVMYICRRRFA